MKLPRRHKSSHAVCTPVCSSSSSSFRFGVSRSEQLIITIQLRSSFIRAPDWFGFRKWARLTRDEIYGAGNGARTRGIKLGKLALCQLSYSRLSINIIKELKREIKCNYRRSCCPRPQPWVVQKFKIQRSEVLGKPWNRTSNAVSSRQACRPDGFCCVPCCLYPVISHCVRHVLCTVPFRHLRFTGFLKILMR